RPVEVLARRVLGALCEVRERGNDLPDAVHRRLGRVEALALDDEVLVGADAFDVASEEVEIVDEDLEWVVDLVREPDGDLGERHRAVVPADLAEVLREADRADGPAAVAADDGAGD